MVQSRFFFAYDILISPLHSYLVNARTVTRNFITRVICRRYLDLNLIVVTPSAADDPVLRVVTKPTWPMYVHPHRSLHNCRQWAEQRRIPCDGVILMDAESDGYAQRHRLWKIKNKPTVDCVIQRCRQPDDLWEIMFRSNATVMQSLHSFRVQQKTYNLPVLLRLSGAFSSGDVLRFCVITFDG